MTDTTSGGRAGVGAAIDSMVANGHVHSVNVQGDSGAQRVLLGDGAPQHTVLRAPTAGTNGRIPDDGIDITAAAAQLQVSLQGLEAKLSEANGFDPKTGEPVLAHPEGSRERANIELQLAQAKRTAALQLKQWAALKAQRAADAAEAGRQQEIERFVGNDPARRDALRAELLKREASEFADRLLGKSKQ